MSIIIAGTVPPPIGGVSIHTRRLLYILAKEGLSYKFIELRPRNNGHINIWKYIRNIFSLILSSKSDVIHYQMNNILEAVLISKCCRIRNKNFIYTFHSFKPDDFNCITSLNFKKCCKTVSYCIAPSKIIKKRLIENGMPLDKIHVISTYLPPTKNELEDHIPDEIKNFCSGEKKILLANAYKLYRDNNGIDVYGLDMCIEACRYFKNIKLLFCVPLIEDETYYQNCCKLINDYKLEDRILIYRKRVSLVTIFQFCDIFIRPTNTDSYGISIEEALSSGVQAIASDVCERTEGTILFKNRNLDDMIKQIGLCLCGNKKLYVASNYTDLINLHKSLIR